MRKEPDNKIVLDIDRNRIRVILEQAYVICADSLGTDFDISERDFVAQIEPYLQSNRVVSVPVYLPLPSKRYPGMKIRVNIQKKQVFVLVHPKSKQAFLNHMLRML